MLVSRLREACLRGQGGFPSSKLLRWGSFKGFESAFGKENAGGRIRTFEGTKPIAFLHRIKILSSQKGFLEAIPFVRFGTPADKREVLSSYLSISKEEKEVLYCFSLWDNEWSCLFF